MPKAKECRTECLKANKKCRAGEQSCQTQAKEKTQKFLSNLAKDPKTVLATVITEANSCYDKDKGMNRHEMNAGQYQALDEQKRIDLINSKHQALEGNLEFVD